MTWDPLQYNTVQFQVQYSSTVTLMKVFVGRPSFGAKNLVVRIGY